VAQPGVLQEVKGRFEEISFARVYQEALQLQEELLSEQFRGGLQVAAAVRILF